MSRVLPILFNTDMVRAILDGRKTVTRRLVKPQMPDACPSCKCMNVDYIYDNNAQNVYCARCGEPFYPEKKSPYQAEDLLYIRETWTKLYYVDPDGCTHYDQEMYFYAADGVPNVSLIDPDGFEEDDQRIRWHPSIHMPKEAARIWLKVTDVRVERLQDMKFEDCLAEGAFVYLAADGNFNRDVVESEAKRKFGELWDSTIKKKDFSIYGWDANPWVWVIEFERCDKPESEGA